MSENKKTLLDRELTRRQFMKLTGKGLAGVALSGSLLDLMGCTLAQAEAGLVDVYPTPDFLLVSNRAKCSGCGRCEAACTIANDGDVHPFMARLHVHEAVPFGANGPADDFLHGDGLFGLWGFAPETCKQCQDPACAKGCPVQAISVDPDTKNRVVDESKCVGCGACVANCPWHMPRIDEEKKKSTKCIGCGACVAGCPNSAIRMVLWEDVAAAL